MVRMLRETIRNGGKIRVFGWRDKSHDEMTRAFERSGIVFTNVRPISANARDYWLLTEQSNKSALRSLQSKGARVSSFILNTAVIKQLLSHLMDLLSLQEQKKAEQARHRVELAGAQGKREPKVLSPPGEKVGIMNISRGTAFTDTDRNFINEFFRAVGKNLVGTLTRVESARITRKYYGPKTNPSQMKSLLEGVKKEGGKRIGNYKLTRSALEFVSSPDIEPTDRLEKLRWLISRRESLLYRRKEITERSNTQVAELDQRRQQIISDRDDEINKIDFELERANEAEKLLEQIDKI